MKKDEKAKGSPPKSTHPWRLCPAGEHWVKSHPLKVPPSKKNPLGSVTMRHAHCAKNPTCKDQLYPDEIQEMGAQHFAQVKEKPCPIDLTFKELGTKYDDFIAGWTKYWNDVLEPGTLLDPNLVKALIASESGFNAAILADKRKPNSARGLMQITNDTRKILADEKGELKDHFLTLTREDLNDPSNNICAGVRWLFRKRAIAASQLGREATWEEAVAEFKGARTVTPERAAKLMGKFNEHMEKLKKCGKS